MPFILRAVSLLGVNIEVDSALRATLWRRLGDDLRPRHLDAIVRREVSLEGLPECFGDYIDSRAVGRTLVKIG
jgi:NADPH2:quinone reductase